MSILVIDDDIDYSLIGIHSSEKAYRLAFLLNKWADTYLIKSELGYPFELFEYEDEINFVSFFLLKNKYLSQENASLGLFEEQMTQTNYVIPEKKEVDYFVKIHDCDTSFLTVFLDKINEIKEIQASYVIDAEKLKTRQNLIF